MPGYEQAVFIHDPWCGKSEEITDQIDEALRKRGLKTLRDK
jgi:hypothetical protein